MGRPAADQGVAPAVCGFAVDAERAALRVRGVFSGMRGEVASRTAAPGTEDGFVFEHATRTVRVERATGGWTAELTPVTDVRLVRVGPRICVFTRTVVQGPIGPKGFDEVRDDVHAGAATQMLARLEHEMRTGW